MGNIVSRAAGAAAEENTSCAFIPDIPDEVVKSEILTRLPVISIVKFRCVCKSWNSLLSSQDPEFVQSHLTRYSANLNNGSLIARNHPFLNPNDIHPLNSKYADLGGSVNGLVCVYRHNWGQHIIQSVGLWNPAINHYKDVPVPPTHIPGIEEAFSFGIGFDPIANDYKVVYITKKLHRPLVAHVYSCNSDSWGIKSVTSTFVAQGYYPGWPAVVHGCPYWYNHDWYNQDDECRQHFDVMFFHVQDEAFRSLPGLDVYYTQRQWRVFVNFRDSLAFMFTDCSPRTTFRSVDVYVFGEKCNLWTKNYTIGPITIPKYMSLLHRFRNGDLLFKSNKYIKLVAINSQTHAINRFASGMYPYDRSRFNLVFSLGCDYMESLVSVKGMSLLHVSKVATDILVIEKCF